MHSGRVSMLEEALEPVPQTLLLLENTRFLSILILLHGSSEPGKILHTNSSSCGGAGRFGALFSEQAWRSTHGTTPHHSI